MTITGWESKYREILKDFGYSRNKDAQSAKLLNSLLQKKTPSIGIRDLIKDKPVFVIGAGPSLPSCISILKRHKKITKIVADGATKAIIENGLRPDIVVTDLDGDIKSLKKAGRTNTIMVVHAHGDNSERINLVKYFKNCIGTTQTKPIGKVNNFGGFTDGDRCVFLAEYFNASKIVLIGMDFGQKIGKYSKHRIVDRKIKIKKLKFGKKIVEWIGTKSKADLFSTNRIKGYKVIRMVDLECIENF